MTTKTLEDFELMETGQLKGILKSLDIPVPELDFRKAENKTKLAQLVLDVQQPDDVADEDAADTPPEPDVDNPDADLDVDAVIAEIGEFFNGNIIPVGETEDEVTLFSVVAEDGNEIEQGTFLDLRDKMLTIQRQEEENAAAAEEDNVDPTPDPEPVADEGDTKEITKRLKPLTQLGLKAEVGKDVVKLRFGSKAVTTTTHQPVHRIVKTAEQLIKIK